ncbi:MAG: YitT family protein [Actinomycetaceae bacterium]|nr:YitT family protein [Actinomycetaceae bacterium]
MKEGLSGSNLKRYATLLLGLTILAFGIAFTIKSGLGTSPISSFPHVVDLVSPLSVGMATILMHFIALGLQILIWGRRFKLIQLLQIPLGIAFGVLLDGAVWVLAFDVPTNYFLQWLLVLLGAVLTGLGVAVQISAKTVPLAAEGLVLAVSERWNIEFGRVKVVNDIVSVLLAIVTSLIASGTIQGVREGTVAASLLVGLVAGPTLRWLRRRHEQ